MLKEGTLFKIYIDQYLVPIQSIDCFVFVFACNITTLWKIVEPLQECIYYGMIIWFLNLKNWLMNNTFKTKKTRDNWLADIRHFCESENIPSVPASGHLNLLASNRDMWRLEVVGKPSLRPTSSKRKALGNASKVIIVKIHVT